MIVFLGTSVAPLAFTLWLCLPDLLRDRGEAMFFVSFAVMVVAGVVYLGASKRRAKSAGVRPSDGQAATAGRERE